MFRIWVQFGMDLGTDFKNLVFVVVSSSSFSFLLLFSFLLFLFFFFLFFLATDPELYYRSGGLSLLGVLKGGPLCWIVFVVFYKGIYQETASSLSCRRRRGRCLGKC